MGQAEASSSVQSGKGGAGDDLWSGQRTSTEGDRVGDVPVPRWNCERFHCGGNTGVIADSRASGATVGRKERASAQRLWKVTAACACLIQTWSKNQISIG